MAESPSRPELLLRRLEWTVIRRLDGLLHGDYRTLFRGFGLDLADLREYQAHDDVRRIDWNVTARVQSPYVRQFNEDRDVTAWFLLDLSPSVHFGSQATTKRATAVELVTVLARLLTRHGNRVGALFYGDRVEGVLAPRTGRRHVLRLVAAMTARPERERPGRGETDLREFLRAAHAQISRRSIVFVVSDFISRPGWERPLAQLALRNELVAVRLLDPLERELPDLGTLLMQDAETGEQLLVDTHDKGFRRRFAAAAAQRDAGVRAAFREARVDALELSTAGDLLDALLRFADPRKRRVAPASAAGRPAHLQAAA